MFAGMFEQCDFRSFNVLAVVNLVIGSVRFGSCSAVKYAIFSYAKIVKSYYNNSNKSNKNSNSNKIHCIECEWILFAERKQHDEERKEAKKKRQQQQWQRQRTHTPYNVMQ